MGAGKGYGVGSGGGCAAGGGAEREGVVGGGCETGTTVEEDSIGGVAAVAAGGGAGVAGGGEAGRGVSVAERWTEDIFVGGYRGAAVAGNVAGREDAKCDVGDWAGGRMDGTGAGSGAYGWISRCIAGEFDFADGDSGGDRVGEY